MIVKKADFILKFILILKKKLEENLPEEDFEYDMIEQAYQVISHIRNATK